MEWGLCLDVTHSGRREPQLLNKGPGWHSQRLMDEKLFFLAASILKFHHDRVSLGLGQALDNTWLNCPVGLLADCRT